MLEGAVYGLFAAEDIVHPDGKTGVVYQKNNLVAVAATDKNGDASFLACTEAPGRIYDYAAGKITQAPGGFEGPENLYTADESVDDYTGDGAYQRIYTDNAARNGNGWIGRPLLLGEYYIKELSRSEGYELSIGNRGEKYTNLGQNLEAGAGESGSGHVAVAVPLYGEEQTGEGGPAGPNEIFFAVESRDTAGAVYDLLLTKLPAGARLYRKDTGKEKEQVEAGTGIYEEIDTGVPAVAEHDYQYPRYQADGSLLQEEFPINYVSDFILNAPGKGLDETLVTAALTAAGDGMTAGQVAEKLEAPFAPEDWTFVKARVEAALRRNQKEVPALRSGGAVRYSSAETPVFDGGVREGERDVYGLSGVSPGQPASRTVYGNPVQTLSIEKAAGMTAEQLIRSILDYYNTNSYLSYGGVDGIEDNGPAYLVSVYAGVAGKPADFMATTWQGETILYHGVHFVPEDAALPPRLIYAPYSQQAQKDCFGTYRDFARKTVGTTVIGSAVFVTDAAADGEGNLYPRTAKKTVYYKTGEIPRDREGKVITVKEYRERTESRELEAEKTAWVPLTMERLANGDYLAHISADFTDAFGAGETNAGTLQILEFKVALPEKTAVLTEADAAFLGAGFAAGQEMNTASYYPLAKRARVRVFLDYENMDFDGGDSYIRAISLEYPGQTPVYEDGGTRLLPVNVQERIIRQKVKLIKDIHTEEGSYAFNTAAASGHEDSFTAGAGKDGEAARALPGFRFKAYLKSNLERLYRNEAGEIAWLDRDGKPVEIEAYQADWPQAPEDCAKVWKLYTRVPHWADSAASGPVSNNVWESAILGGSSLYGRDGEGRLQDTPYPGYTRLLETVSVTAEDGAGACRQIEQYNYEKFFAALQAANEDVWDKKNPVSTSFKPPAWVRALLFGDGGGGEPDAGSTGEDAVLNTANTGKAAEEIARRSDAVRQFAIDWYLEDEAAKRTKEAENGGRQPLDGKESYQDALYDEALFAAIEKAENYLKPFYTYDLDEIYAVPWDSAPGGGSDGDPATLSADAAGQGKDYYWGASLYLPYGTYVCVEQQPGQAELGDFVNQHYQTDRPREICVPSLYEAGGNEAQPPVLSHEYEYAASDSPEELAGKYQIRMNEEWADTNRQDLREYVIRAHNQDGDFEIYKYGLAKTRLSGTVSAAGEQWRYQGFTVAQEESDPYKDVYRTENEESRYRSNEKVADYYFYGSLAEQAGTAQDVRFTGGGKDGNNPLGYRFKDQVKTITGSLTGYDGLYFQALVPYSVMEPALPSAYSAGDFEGYADRRFHNTFYTARLRIEKLDAETGENILHDGAEFAIYAALREDGPDSEGRVRFYETDTRVTASREFLLAMGASDITPADKTQLIPSVYPWRKPYVGLYTGVIPAGTPVCIEGEQIKMQDESGLQTGTFRVFSTLTDFADGGKNGVPTRQNAGYLETPQPLGAGVYVLCELDPPAGYVRSKPIAVESYSDAVTYYLDGERDRRVAAAVYEEEKQWNEDRSGPYLNPDKTVPNYNKQKDFQDLARIYVGNTPIQLAVSKVKQEEETVFFELSGRIEGSLTELAADWGLENLELAYNASGHYQGYAWPKGFLEMLEAWKEAGEELELLYEDSLFTGRAVLARTPDTAEAVNRYLPGAKMTLYEAIPVVPNGDREDRAWSGVNVVRDSLGNVTRMYVKKGYAGRKSLYVRDKDVAGDEENDYARYTYDDATDDVGAGTWVLKTVEREDTDILYYDLGGLSVFETVDGNLYGYDRRGALCRAKDGRSLFAMKDGRAFLEICCPDYENLHYSEKDRLFDRVPAGTKVYHLAGDGLRDAQVDPYTGMAYVTEEKTGKILVWPVQIARDPYGNIIARDKIKTFRLATMAAGTAEEYTVGTYDGAGLQKTMNPAVNEAGLPLYYQRTKELYSKGAPLYDRDGDYVRYQYSALLAGYNANAWELNLKLHLLDVGQDPETEEDDRPLYHRAGEGFLIENTWITGETTPDDPFDQRELSAGQADVLKRVCAGTYILEELAAPEGYTRALPVGVTVEESRELQTARMIDVPVTIRVDKLDAPETFRHIVLDTHGILEEKKKYTEGTSGYTFRSVRGASLALYPARRVATEDREHYPEGYYLEKTSEDPFTYEVLSEDNTPRQVTAAWTMGETPLYLEGIPAGDYVLEETGTPAGYVPASRGITIEARGELQNFVLPNDHIKAAFYKYETKEGKKEPLSNENPAVLALYPALRDADGLVRMDENGAPLYDAAAPVASWRTEDARGYTEGEDSFSARFQALYEEYQSGFQTVTWQGGSARRLWEKATEQGETSRQLWDLGNGSQALVHVSRNGQPAGNCGYVYDFKWNYRQENGLVTYDTSDGCHRIDYLPLTDTAARRGYYVLVETAAPEGYYKSAPRLCVVEETAELQLYAMENSPASLLISKEGRGVWEDAGPLLAGAQLALYRADGRGELTVSEEFLTDRWVSGKEGTYTEAEAESGRIPEGFKIGDLKPHRISPLPFGTYYLTEEQAPQGYTAMAPVRLEVTPESAPVFQAVNTVKKGVLCLEKADEEEPQEKLGGAVFSVTNTETGETVFLTTDESGRAVSPYLATGRPGAAGAWQPYTFRVQETVPPEGYQLNLETREFQFADTGSETLTYTLTVTDEKTRIAFSKTDFGTELFLEGAQLAVFGVCLEDDGYRAEEEPLETWTSGQSPHVIEGKLSAGHVYLLKELAAPEGYALEDPVLFTISDDGRRIQAINGSLGRITLQTSDSLTDAVEALLIQGRRAVRSVLLLHGPNPDQEPVILPQGQKAEEILPGGLRAGELYELEEKIYFSDGSHLNGNRMVFRASGRPAGASQTEARPTGAGQDAAWLPAAWPGRSLLDTRLRLEAEDGTLIEEWSVENEDGLGYAHQILNPEYEEPGGIRVISENGKEGTAVQAGTALRYEIRCRNDGKKMADMEVSLTLDPALEFMPANSTEGFERKGDALVWKMEGLKPGEQGTLTAAAAVKNDVSGSVSARVRIAGETWEARNPVMEEGTLAIVSTVSGTAADELREEEVLYTIYLTDPSGEPLRGAVSYTPEAAPEI